MMSNTEKNYPNRVNLSSNDYLKLIVNPRWITSSLKWKLPAADTPQHLLPQQEKHPQKLSLYNKNR